MPSIQEGLTYADSPEGRAPEAPIPVEQERETARIREQSAAARQTPADDDSFNKASIHEAFSQPTGIAAGLRTPGDAQSQREALEQKSREAADWLDSEEGQKYQHEQEEIERGKSLVRLHDVVLPAFETLAQSWEDGDRASAWATLSPSEKQSAIDQGLVDEEEGEALLALATQILDERQRISATAQAALADDAAGRDRNERWQAIKSEFGLSEGEAQALLGVAIERTQEAGHHLGALPPAAWESAVRHVYGQVVAEDLARSKSDFKTQILQADSTNISEGLTENGRPVVPRMVAVEQPDYTLAEMLASGRNRPETDDEIRLGVLNYQEPTSVKHGVSEGGDQIPADVQAKMRAVFGS